MSPNDPIPLEIALLTKEELRDDLVKAYATIEALRLKIITLEIESNIVREALVGILGERLKDKPLSYLVGNLEAFVANR